MTLLIVLLCVAGLVGLIAVGKLNAFVAFLLTALAAGVLLGMPLADIPKSIEKGIGDTLGGLVLILCLGAVLGKLLAESGAAQVLAGALMRVFGVGYVQWAMVLTGFVVGIPLYYGVGFVLLVPLIFSIAARYRLPAIYIGLPMLAALSVTHGFLPPHPSPAALVVQFKANMGLTLLYGLAVAIPTIIVAGPLFARTLTRIVAKPLEAFAAAPEGAVPSTANSFFTALLPVLLLTLAAAYPYLAGGRLPGQAVVALLGQPSVAMLLAVAYATYSVGLRLGKTMPQLMGLFADAIKDISMILLIIGASGALKQVLTDSGASAEVAALLQHVALPPLLLGWLMAAVLRACVGSATVAHLSLVMPAASVRRRASGLLC
ncbi:MAG: gluconate transporter, partial [Hymenobacter sp.]